MGQEDKHAEKRAKLLAASLEEANEPRWGYFGVTGSLAIGDNSYSPIVTRKPKDEEADTEPLRQIQTNPAKKGGGVDCYFSFETGVNLGDPYKDPAGMIKMGKVAQLDPEAAFRPPGAVRESVNKLGYEYMDHKDSLKDPKEVREKYRDYMPPRQILSNPAKKGGGGVITPGVLFGMSDERRFPEHVPDDYNNARKIRVKELEEHRAKLQEMPFRPRDYGYRNFSTNEEMFHVEGGSHIPRDKVPSKTQAVAHESPFRPANPSKKGVPESLMGGIPEYMPDPPTVLTRKPKNDDEKAPFKLNHPKGLMNPQSSVVCMQRNMRRERPTSFVRPSL
jgi:hypothetical protein